MDKKYVIYKNTSSTKTLYYCGIDEARVYWSENIKYAVLFTEEQATKILQHPSAIANQWKSKEYENVY